MTAPRTVEECAAAGMTVGEAARALGKTVGAVSVYARRKGLKLGKSGSGRPPLTPAARDVLAERRRQVEVEGFTAGHDDAHIRGELGAAAACYAVPSRQRRFALQHLWPTTWSELWFKPAGAHDDLRARRRDLVRAAALILAEIERLDRLAEKEPPA